VRLSAVLALDERVLRIARTSGHSPAAERAVAGFSRLGERGALWLALGAAGSVLAVAGPAIGVGGPGLAATGPADGVGGPGLAGPNRRAGWRRATATVAGVYTLNTALKLIVRRPRPELPGLPALTSTPTQLSFPSAHASTSFAGALAYSRLGLPAIPLYALAAGLALSRLYLGVHYPSDVLAGALLGTAIAAAIR
jgi:membrane-associated phospholipid phosphatase